jgi:hypothetical protein
MSVQEYIIRTLSGDGQVYTSRIYRSADEAHAEVASCVTKAGRTVHRLSDPIPAPEPREWVVVDENGVLISGRLLTRNQADVYFAGGEGGDRILRLVPEDGAQ